MAIHMEKHKAKLLTHTTCSHRSQTDLRLFLAANMEEMSLDLYDSTEIKKKKPILHMTKDTSCIKLKDAPHMCWAACVLSGDFTEKMLHLTRNQNIQITTTMKFHVRQLSKNDLI